MEEEDTFTVTEEGTDSDGNKYTKVKKIKPYHLTYDPSGPSISEEKKMEKRKNTWVINLRDQKENNKNQQKE